MKPVIVGSETKSFNTKNKIITASDNMEVINNFNLEIMTKIENFQEKDSEWGL